MTRQEMATRAAMTGLVNRSIRIGLISPNQHVSDDTYKEVDDGVRSDALLLFERLADHLFDGQHTVIRRALELESR